MVPFWLHSRSKEATGLVKMAAEVAAGGAVVYGKYFNTQMLHMFDIYLPVKKKKKTG